MAYPRADTASKTILSGSDLHRVVDRIAHQILEKTSGATGTVVLQRSKSLFPDVPRLLMTASQDTLVSLASDTGGKAFMDSNDFGDAFAQLAMGAQRRAGESGCIRTSAGVGRISRRIRRTIRSDASPARSR